MDEEEFLGLLAVDLPTGGLDTFDDNWYPFAGFEHDNCSIAGPCHCLFVIVLDWSFYLDTIQFPWLEIN